MAYRQITKDEFFNSIWRRQQDYAIALTNSTGALVQQILTISSNFISETKQQDKQYNIFGTDYWGYGLNYIDDSENKYSNPDIRLIQKSPELNKHQKYNIFHLMIFRVENSELIYNILSTDLCSGKTDKQINKRKKLDTLNNVIVNQRDSVNTIKLCFDDGSNFTFETDFRYRVWDYAPDYKNVFDEIISNNKKETARQQASFEEKLNVLLERLNTLVDGHQIIYDDFMEIANANLKANDKNLLTKIKDKVTEVIAKKGIEIVVADAMKEVEKIF